MYLQVGLFFPWLIPLYFDGWLFLSNEDSSSTCYHLSFRFLNMNKICLFINCILTYESFFPLIFILFFYYFVLPVCFFVPEFLFFFPPTGALITERAPAARGVRSQGWHHNERQRAAVPQDLHPPLRASQVRDPLKLEGGLLKKNHWHSLRFSIIFRRYSVMERSSWTF